MKFLQTKPQNKNMNNNSYDLYYNVIKNRGKNIDVEKIYNDESDYITYRNFNIPSHVSRIKHREPALR